MTERRQALTTISDALHAQFGAIAMLNQPADQHLVYAARFLADAIDMVDVAVQAATERRVPA